jgi:filamentous hemagglutinin
MDSGLVTVDNTRVLAAHMTDTPVQAIVHGVGDALPASMAGRFGNATTWGEAVLYRIGNQNAAYRSLFPGGSWFIGVGTP